MKITVDTNVLVRAIIGDDRVQSKKAQSCLEEADQVALTIPALCELVWVLARGYKVSNAKIASVVRQLINSENVAVNSPAALAGVALLEAGGDFADGAIAYEGAWLGAEEFVSFDRLAVKKLTNLKRPARLLK